MMTISTSTPIPIHIFLFMPFLPPAEVVCCGVEGVAGGGGVPAAGVVAVGEAGGSWVAVGGCWLSELGSIG
jgi:hypothetical protein